MEQILNYIDGALQKPLSNAWLDNYEPATGQVYSQVPDSDERDVAAGCSRRKEGLRQLDGYPAGRSHDAAYAHSRWCGAAYG